MPDLKESLREFNPWWRGEFHLDFRPRSIYQEIQKFFPLRQIIALTGLRRVGKTTLLEKAALDKISSGFPASHVLYVSFDEFRNIELREVLKAYEDLLGVDIRDGASLLLLDEIQKLDDWDDQLKVLYDTAKDIKIVISGSESLFIRRRSRETLAGRIFEFKVEPLTFKEFLSFKGIDLRPVGLYEKELSRRFAEFMKTLGLPELVGIEDKTVVKKYVRESLVEKVIYRDLPGLLKVKDIAVLESILNIFMEEPGQLIEISGLAGELNLARPTLSNYLMYLEESFLVRKLYNFSTNRRKTERKLKKYYPAVPSVDLLFREDRFSLSKVFECHVVNQLRAEFFWRDPLKHEVDVVLVGEETCPVEIKFGKIETRGLEAFLKKFDGKRGVIISRDQERTIKVADKTIEVVPAYKYFLS
jgi:predicted AAA+ superfamily ATPase